jgi:hypothetical protein
MVTMQGPAAVDLDVAGFDLDRPPPGFHENPYPWYAALRTKAPVKRLANGGVLLSRYADLLAVYQNPAAFSSDKRKEFAPKLGSGRLFRHHTTSLVFNDPPHHGRVRNLIMGALVPRAIAQREAGLSDLVQRLLSEMADHDQADLIADFAGAIPLEIIGDLLQIPQEERGSLRAWSLAILGALEPAPTAEALAAGEQALAEFHDCLERLVAERWARPRDLERDLLSRLIVTEVDGERLSYEELLENCIFLLNAGHETTTNLIGNLLEALWRHPSQRQRLVESPALIRTAVEEGLRFESSNQLGNRIVAMQTQVAGVALLPGVGVTLCIGAANRDPDAFQAPETFDIGRSPNRHLAFASGPHQCAGMNLARMEARVAVAAFISRFPDYQILPGAERRARMRFRGFDTLPAHLQSSS